MKIYIVIVNCAFNFGLVERLIPSRICIWRTFKVTCDNLKVIALSSVTQENVNAAETTLYCVLFSRLFSALEFWEQEFLSV